MTYDQLTDMLYWLEGGMTYNAIAEVKSEIKKLECDCDSADWCKQYNKCNRAMLDLPIYQDPFKQTLR